jgi:hypothetical protein
MKRGASILLADDHALVRRGVRVILDSEPGLDVVAEAENGAEAVANCRDRYIDLAILDVAMPTDPDAVDVRPPAVLLSRRRQVQRGVAGLGELVGESSHLCPLCPPVPPVPPVPAVPPVPLCPLCPCARCAPVPPVRRGATRACP